jgi:F0F1-type ATP synthase assembly protein I
LFEYHIMTDFKENNNRKEASNFARYSGIAFQMLAIIGIMTFIGYKIDESRESKQQIFTALFGLVGVVISLIQVVRSLNKK